MGLHQRECGSVSKDLKRKMCFEKYEENLKDLSVSETVFIGKETGNGCFRAGDSEGGLRMRRG